MIRVKAFLTHFGLSVFIVSLVLTIVLLFWYPPPFFQIIGASDALKVLIGVDLVMGPLLTLVLFKPGKPGLVFDMSCVALLQLSALAYGVSVLHEERPYFAVFAQDRFEVLARKDVDLSETDNAELKKKPWRQPIFVVATMPSDEKEYQQALEEILFEGKPDIQYQPRFWSTYAESSDQVLSQSKPLDALLKSNPDLAATIKQMLNDHPQSDALAYVPVIGKKQPFALVIDKSTKMPVDIIKADPYKKSQQLSRVDY